MNTHQVTIRLRFEAAHRLPHLPGKCVNLHGHSWQAHITAAAPHLNQKDMVVDFSDLKRAIETFTDTHLDHGAMLGAADPYASRLDRKSTRLNSSHVAISYAVFCLKKKSDGSTQGRGQRYPDAARPGRR